MSKVSTLVDCSDPEAVECLNDFVESIQLEMSVGGMIPFTIPAEVIAQLVKNAKTYYDIIIVCFFIKTRNKEKNYGREKK